MGVHYISLAALFVIATFPSPATAENARTDVESLPCIVDTRIPANVLIGDEFLWSLTSEMARRSPTFERQLTVIGSLTQVRAKIRLVLRAPSSTFVAHAEILHTKAGFLLADIQIPRRLLFANRYVESIAHELEHVIEQAEGIDLKALARKPDSGVYTLAWGSKRPYETVRAQEIGRVVAREHFEHESTACEARIP